MARIKLEAVGKEVYVCGITDEGELLEFETVNRPLDGNLIIGNLSVRHDRGISRIDPRLLDDGIYETNLITRQSILRLPKIEIRGGELRPTIILTEMAESLAVRLSEADAEISEIKQALAEIKARLGAVIM